MGALRPELRAYFYDQKPCPTGGSDRDIVITIGEMFADVLGSTLVGNRLVPATESEEVWAAYTRRMLTSSPTLAELVRTNPQWWPKVAELL